MIPEALRKKAEFDPVDHRTFRSDPARNNPLKKKFNGKKVRPILAFLENSYVVKPFPAFVSFSKKRTLKEQAELLQGRIEDRFSEIRF
ncbi:hypothetical protein [Leptospira santarosai]|uniref:hypothetical protein n=1 Tax=Leptospira santarosai TaxID=28183 RepID=UPI000248BC10|nr:hypothetical protein [Leptospira santarosai]EMM76017.1 hypothetical protein LEP1GSC040_3917 [Leptospira santarosai str. 2000030832]